MVPSLERGISITSSFNLDRMFDSSPGKEQQQPHLAETTMPESQTQDSLGGSPVETSRPMTSRLISRRQDKQQSGD